MYFKNNGSILKGRMCGILVHWDRYNALVRGWVDRGSQLVSTRKFLGEKQATYGFLFAGEAKAADRFPTFSALPH